MKFDVGIEQHGVAHRETEDADATGRGKARMKKFIGSNGILVEIADGPGRTAVSVTGVIKNNRRYAVVMEVALYANPLRNSFADSVEDEQRNMMLATGGCLDKVSVQESAATGDLQALVGEPDGGWGV
jgi:hypothetical protein